MMRIINKTDFGLVFKCYHCRKIHIEFGNLNFNLSEEEFNFFSEYLEKLDGDYWECRNATSIFTKKIRIPLSGSQAFCILLDKEELKQLKELVLIPDSHIPVTKRLLQEMELPGFLN